MVVFLDRLLYSTGQAASACTCHFGRSTGLRVPAMMWPKGIREEGDVLN